MSKPTVITKPTKIETVGDKIKIIEEYVGVINTNTEQISIAHMYALEGWKEVGQCPEFDEFTIILKGILRIEFKDGVIDIQTGQAVIAHKGEWVRYSTPSPGGAEYISVCLPAFSPQKVHRDAP